VKAVGLPCPEALYGPLECGHAGTQRCLVAITPIAGWEGTGFEGSSDLGVGRVPPSAIASSHSSHLSVRGTICNPLWPMTSRMVELVCTHLHWQCGAAAVSSFSSGRPDEPTKEGKALLGRPRAPADSIVSIGIAPSRQGPAPDMSSASASPTLTALACFARARTLEADRAVTWCVDTFVDVHKSKFQHRSRDLSRHD
jgi:hypothetical protein